MQRLHLLLHSIDSQQVKILKNYLTSFSTRDANTKLWELAAFVLKDKEAVPSMEAASRKIYKSATDGRIEKLKNRLYSKVLDSFLIDINLNRDIYEDEIHPIRIRLRKKMILYELIQFTPLKFTLGVELINDIITVSKRFEFYPILLDALYIQKSVKGLKFGVEFFHSMTKEIDFYEKCKRHSQRSLDLYAEMGMYATFISKADKSKLELFLKNSISELQTYFLDTNVKMVGYQLKTFEMTLLQLNKKLKEAKEVALAMLEFMRNNKTVGRRVRLGIWHTYIAQFDMELGDYDSAIKHLLLGREYFTGSQLNIAINKKFEADAYFLKEEYLKVIEIAEELAGTDLRITGNFRRDIMFYFKGCALFMLGEFRGATRIFNLKFEMTKDKLGWEINLRFMRIMTMIELGCSDEALAMVETTSKHIDRYQQIKDLSERDRLVLRLFRELSKEGFSFQQPGLKVFHLLLQLQEKGKPYSWETLTPELIPVNIWVIRKYGKIIPPSAVQKKSLKVFKTANPRKKSTK